MRVNRIARCLAAFALALLAGCATPADAVFTPLGPMTDAQIVSRLRARAGAIKTMYAVLEIAYDSEKMDGTFEAASNYVAPGKMRMTAFKDLLVMTEPIFDMLLTPERYWIDMRRGNGGKAWKDAGSRGEFAAKHRDFAIFSVVGEGMFLPGIGAERVSGGVAAGGVVARTVEGTLPSGAPVRWLVVPETLEVIGGEVEKPGGERVRIAYEGYRSEDGAVVPGEVRVDDGPTKMRVRVSELEVNVPIDASLFQPAGVR